MYTAYYQLSDHPLILYEDHDARPTRELHEPPEC